MVFINTKEHDTALKKMHNADEEDQILRRYPFHEAMTEQAVLSQYSGAVRFMLRVVPKRHQIAVMGRLARKLIKRVDELKIARDENYPSR